MNLVVKSGSAADPQNRAGLASLTADLLDEGTKKRSALEISNSLTDIGARLGTSADWDSSSTNLVTLTRHLDKALDIYADVVTNPAFNEDELNAFARPPSHYCQAATRRCEHDCEHRLRFNPLWS